MPWHIQWFGLSKAGLFSYMHSCCTSFNVCVCLSTAVQHIACSVFLESLSRSEGGQGYSTAAPHLAMTFLDASLSFWTKQRNKHRFTGILFYAPYQHCDCLWWYAAMQAMHTKVGSDFERIGSSECHCTTRWSLSGFDDKVARFLAISS